MTGERRFVGLYTSSAYHADPRDIPLLRRKVARVLQTAGFPPASHGHKNLVSMLHAYPRDELFQVDERSLFEIAMGVLAKREDVVHYVSDRLVEIARSVPDRIPSFNLGGRGAALFHDDRIFDFKKYPESVYKQPGDKQPSRAALGVWGAWVNGYAKKQYGRPLFVVCSADLADLTVSAAAMPFRKRRAARRIIIMTTGRFPFISILVSYF